ncbi:alpha/beta fold hydrolase [Streptomyces muensis]|uniref:Alpha/beta fold hydrolase n=1 Tax=Streptomyces muensis TaxID=1077944 RepID=A0A9X1PTM3_STRM4|nr:alpha/beta fold hydrolase [Streptomyces muensis]MCF1592913.1 alpha/beta fold hydrolase [Streptomyces muensis]
MRTLVSQPSVSRATALSLGERLSAATHLASSLEYLTTERDREQGGFNNWEVVRESHLTRPPLVLKALDIVARPRVTRALHMARVGAAAALLAPSPRGVRVAANAVLSGTSLLMYPVNHYGTDGSDQVSFLVQSVTTVARAGERNRRLVDACLWFIALQSTLSYAVSGWVKLSSPTWRSGRALPGVMRTLTYGDRPTWELARRHPRAAHALCAGVLALECAFPLAFVAKGRPALLMVGSAAAFHLANARLMGLGRFLSSFVSMHPAVLYAAGPRERVGAEGGMERRDDALPALSLVLLAATLGALQVDKGRRRRKVSRGRGDEREFTASSGNTLSYRRTGPEGTADDGNQPLVVLESGLVATAEHWEWIARGISEQFPVVIYNRAGYGPSTYAGDGAEGYLLDAAVDDLVDLIAHTAGDRPVVVAGHSLGGYLALKAADRIPGRIVGAVLLDSSHPAELQRSSRQAQGQKALSDSLALLTASLKLGLGALLTHPTWVDRLPEEVRELSEAQYRDPGLWAAGRREWRAVQAEFDAFDGKIPDADVPLLVMTAGHTASQDPIQQELHTELAEGAPGSAHHVIEGADHDSILTDRDAAGHVVMLVTNFVAGLGSGNPKPPNEPLNKPLDEKEDTRGDRTA